MIQTLYFNIDVFSVSVESQEFGSYQSASQLYNGMIDFYNDRINYEILEQLSPEISQAIYNACHATDTVYDGVTFEVFGKPFIQFGATIEISFAMGLSEDRFRQFLHFLVEWLESSEVRTSLSYFGKEFHLVIKPVDFSNDAV